MLERLDRGYLQVSVKSVSVHASSSRIFGLSLLDMILLEVSDSTKFLKRWSELSERQQSFSLCSIAFDHQSMLQYGAKR